MTTPSTPLARARQQDTAHRRQRVLKALNQLAATHAELSVSAVARAARVHRSFIYRHPDLHAAVLAQAAHTAQNTDGATISRQSLLAELASASDRNRRQAQRITQLEQRLSDLLGEAVWRDSGLGAPADLDTLQRRNTHLEQQVTDLQRQLNDRTDELDAARATNRDLMTQLNRRDAL